MLKRVGRCPQRPCRVDRIYPVCDPQVLWALWWLQCWWPGLPTWPASRLPFRPHQLRRSFLCRDRPVAGAGLGVGVRQGPAAPSPPLHLPTPQKWMSVPLELKAGAVSHCPLSSPPGLRRLPEDFPLNHRPLFPLLTLQMRLLLLIPSQLPLALISGELGDRAPPGPRPEPLPTEQRERGSGAWPGCPGRRVWHRLGTAAQGPAALGFAGARQAQGRSLAQLCCSIWDLEGDSAFQAILCLQRPKSAAETRKTDQVSPRIRQLEGACRSPAVCCKLFTFHFWTRERAGPVTAVLGRLLSRLVPG